MNISFFVPGRPLGKKRYIPIYGRRGKTPKVTKDYEKLIGQLALEARNNKAKIYAPSKKMFNLMVIIYYNNWHYLPDGSNVLKSVEDGMNGIIYEDDKQVAGGAFKRFKVEDERLVGVGVTAEERLIENYIDQAQFRS